MPTPKRTSAHGYSETAKQEPAKKEVVRYQKPVPGPQLSYTDIRLDVIPVGDGVGGSLIMDILEGRYRSISSIQPEGTSEQSGQTIAARFTNPPNSPESVIFDMDRGQQNMVEVHVQGQSGGSNTTFLKLSFRAYNNDFIVRMFVPGYVSVSPYVYSGNPPVTYVLKNTKPLLVAP